MIFSSTQVRKGEADDDFLDNVGSSDFNLYGHAIKPIDPGSSIFRGDPNGPRVFPVIPVSNTERETVSQQEVLNRLKEGKSSRHVSIDVNNETVERKVINYAQLARMNSDVEGFPPE